MWRTDIALSLSAGCLAGASHLVCELVGCGPMLARTRFSGLLLVFLGLCFVPVGESTCPYCFGNIGSCKYDAERKCPAADLPVQNAGLVANVAAVVSTGVSLTLTNVISPRFLRMFSKAHLSALLQLLQKPPAGTIFEITVDTKLTHILQAISNGMVTMEQAAIVYAGFIDEETDSDKRSALRETYKLLTSTKDFKAFTSGSNAPMDQGYWTWLYGKVSTFVAERGMQTTVSLEVGSSSAADEKKNGVLSSTIKRFKNSWDFMEALNLFMMFATALGLCSCVALAEFYEFVVFDTIRMRKQPWELAAELFVVMLRRIEDSAGRLNLVNATNEVHLNTVMDEARANTEHFHGAAFFRTRAGNARIDATDDDVKWNKKFTSTSKTACVYFNSGRSHPASALHPDGTCKYNHVCDHWVTDKGKGGRCLGTAGTPGHARLACDNPNKCESKQQ